MATLARAYITDMLTCQFGRPNLSLSRSCGQLLLTVSELPSPGVSRPIPRLGKQPSSTAALFQTGIPVVPSRFKLEYLATGTTSAALFTQTPQLHRPHDQERKGELRELNLYSFSAIGFKFLNLFMKKQPKNCRNLVKVKLILF